MVIILIKKTHKKKKKLDNALQIIKVGKKKDTWDSTTVGYIQNREFFHQTLSNAIGPSGIQKVGRQFYPAQHS